MTLEKFTATVRRGPSNETWGTPNNGWKVTLRNGRGNRYTVAFYTGLGITSEPTAAEVLDCLVRDAQGYRDAGYFEAWAAEYGYDTDSRAALKTFNACRRVSERLETFLTAEEFQSILDSEG